MNLAQWSVEPAEPILQRLGEPVDCHDLGLLGPDKPAQPPDPAKIAGLSMPRQHDGVSREFFFNLSALGIEQPPVVVGLMSIGGPTVGCQADNLASGRVHRAHSSRWRSGPPTGD